MYLITGVCNTKTAPKVPPYGICVIIVYIGGGKGGARGLQPLPPVFTVTP